MTNDWTVREATADDLTDVLGVLDAAALETDPALVETSIERRETFVAVRDGGQGTSSASGAVDRPVLGALVLVDDEIEAVAVRRRVRDQDVGTALVDAAGGRRDHLTAEFDASIRPFYESLGFETEPLDEPGRVRGRRRSSEGTTAEEHDP